ncbi:MAG: MinD/ParA family protein [Eubacteriales bacterium]|nr:MinD/ParA family protein [Eubacteriales bacterium]
MIDQAEGLRLMANIQKMKQTRIITVASGKGGVGKSSLALNMAIALNRKGKRALIIDMDFGFSNIDVMLGVSTKYDLMDVIKNQKETHEIIEEGLGGVQFISGGSGVYELTQLGTNELMLIVNNLLCLDDIADTIIFDAGAGVSDNILRLIHASHETVLVTTPEPTAVVDAYAMIKIISEQAADTNISLVLNKADSPQEAQTVMEGLIRIAKKNTGIGINNLGYIIRDANMSKAVRMQVPILVSFPKCTASLNIEQIVVKFLNIPTAVSKKLGVISFLERFIEKKNKTLE